MIQGLNKDVESIIYQFMGYEDFCIMHWRLAISTPVYINPRVPPLEEQRPGTGGRPRE